MTPSLPPAVAALAHAARAAATAWEAEQAARLYRTDPHPYGLVAEIGTAVDECRTVPPADGLTRSREKAALVAEGWRFLAIPTHRKRTGRRLAPALDWDTRAWLAVPPEGASVPARRFATKAPALAWAKAQTAERAGPDAAG